MKMRVAWAKSRYKDTVYETPLVMTSYRDDKGVARNKTVVSLAKLPRFVVDLIAEALKRGDDSVLAEYVHIDSVQHVRSVVLGPVFTVLSLLKQLGVYQALRASLSLKQAAAVLAALDDDITMSLLAQMRKKSAAAIMDILTQEKNARLTTEYTALPNKKQKH